MGSRSRSASQRKHLPPHAPNLPVSHTERKIAQLRRRIKRLQKELNDAVAYRKRLVKNA